MENSIILKHYGRLYNPVNWFYKPNYLTNRIHYIIGGTAYYKNEVRLKPGYIYIFKADPSFQCSQDPNDPIDHIYFDFISSIQLIEKEYIEICIDEVPRLRGIVDALSMDFSMDSFPPSVVESYFNIFAYELRDYLLNSKAYSDLTLKTLHYIHEHAPAELTVAGIADSLNININHLIRTFKKETGITPLKYIGMMKSELAISYARQGYSFDEIAVLLGYSTVSALSVAFKNTTNKNLSEFK